MAFSILIVDDEVDFAESIADVLEMENYQVALAFNGKDGVAAVRAQPFDLVLLDMKMPDMDGFTCLTALRAERPEIDVIMVSAFTKSELLNQTVKGGAVGVFEKPVTPNELLDALAFLHAGDSILQVDDNQDFSDTLEAVLKEEGFEVRKASSLAEARGELEREAVALILLDYKLSDGPGTKLMDWLAENGRKERVILLTAFRGEMKLEQPYLEAKDVLVKPLSIEYLMKVVAGRQG